MAKMIPIADVIKRRGSDELWLVVDGIVYDVGEFAPDHPGGCDVLRSLAGRDATAVYSSVHPPSLISTTLPPHKHLGRLDTRSMPPDWHDNDPAATITTTTTTNAAGNSIMPARPPLQALISAHDFEAAAEATYSPKAWAFLSSAATDLHTKRRNASAYADIGLRPRVLRDVSSVSTAATVLGRRVRAPIFCSPTSLGCLFHPEGEKALGRACARLGIPQCVSTSASFPLPAIVDAVREAEAAGTDGRKSTATPIFFQLYVDKHRARSTSLLAEAIALGVSAVFLTVDAPVPGKREADERIASSRADEQSTRTPMAPGAVRRSDDKGGALGRVMGSYIDSSVSWRDLAWLRESCPGVPLVLKGVQTAADAVMAADAGVDAILISNHGGRSVDTSPAPICVLLELHRCCPDVFGKLEVYVDGGISRGADIFKALCLGVRAVGLGRGLLYGLAYGEEGVQRYVEILIDELETTMKMCGVTSIDQLHPGLVNTLALDPLIPTTMDGHPYAKWPPEVRNSKL